MIRLQGFMKYFAENCYLMNIYKLNPVMLIIFEFCLMMLYQTYI